MQQVRLTTDVGTAVLCASLLAAFGCGTTPVTPSRAAGHTPTLMSADVAIPAPRVGRSYLTRGANSDDVATDSLKAPKTDTPPKSADGSRRGGQFGALK